MQKKDMLGGAIYCGALNRINKTYTASIPHCVKMFDLIGSAKFCAKLDLRASFHQIGIAEYDIAKNAFKTEYSSFEFLVTPMGLRNAPATIQALTYSIIITK